jgi:cardiolipin synthase (CMP-forming)
MPDPLAPYRGKATWRTPSNAISILRAVLAIPAAYAVWNGNHLTAAALFIFAFITDLADGYVARKLGDVSEFGKIVDPLADKVFVGAIVIVMVMRRMLPVWFVSSVLARDLIIFVAGVWASRKFRVVLPSNYPGKGAVFVISLTLLLAVFGVPQSTLLYFEAVSMVLMLVSLGLYARRLLVLLKETSTLAG